MPPGRLGLIGGHVEDDDPATDVLEGTARRELIEETGVDLTGVPLRYVASELFSAGEDDLQVTVTFVADAPPGAEPSARSDGTGRGRLVDAGRGRGGSPLPELAAGSDPARGRAVRASTTRDQPSTRRRTVSGRVASLSTSSGVNGLAMSVIT